MLDVIVILDSSDMIESCVLLLLHRLRNLKIKFRIAWENYVFPSFKPCKYISICNFISEKIKKLMRSVFIHPQLILFLHLLLLLLRYINNILFFFLKIFNDITVFINFVAQIIIKLFGLLLVFLNLIDFLFFVVFALNKFQ